MSAAVTVTRADVVAEARRWLGTPYRHQGRSRLTGCDCLGLVGGVALALGLLPEGWWEREFDARWAGYGRHPQGSTLRAGAEQVLTPVSQPAPGDVLLVRFGREPQHFAIVAEHPLGTGLSIVHAASQRGRVVEQGLDAAWRQRIVAIYRLPGVVA